MSIVSPNAAVPDRTLITAMLLLLAASSSTASALIFPKQHFRMQAHHEHVQSSLEALRSIPDRILQFQVLEASPACSSAAIAFNDTIYDCAVDTYTLRFAGSQSQAAAYCEGASSCSERMRADVAAIQASCADGSEEDTEQLNHAVALLRQSSTALCLRESNHYCAGELSGIFDLARDHPEEFTHELLETLCTPCFPLLIETMFPNNNEFSELMSAFTQAICLKHDGEWCYDTAINIFNDMSLTERYHDGLCEPCFRRFGAVLSWYTGDNSLNTLVTALCNEHPNGQTCGKIFDSFPIVLNCPGFPEFPPSECSSQCKSDFEYYFDIVGCCASSYVTMTEGSEFIVEKCSIEVENECPATPGDAVNVAFVLRISNLKSPAADEAVICNSIKSQIQVWFSTTRRHITCDYMGTDTFSIHISSIPADNSDFLLAEVQSRSVSGFLAATTVPGIALFDAAEPATIVVQDATITVNVAEESSESLSSAKWTQPHLFSNFVIILMIIALLFRQ